MPGTVLVGAQWGDEGKGKITDLLSAGYDYVVRYQGGNNAGHTVIHGDVKLALHLVPSGIMYESCIPVIGNGCVVDPKVLLDEMDMLEKAGISTARLLVSGNAHLIMPYHITLDGASEEHLGDKKIGTTKRGIGPAYQDKVARVGLRIQDLEDEALFRERLAAALAEKNEILTKVYGLEPFTVDEIAERYMGYAKRIVPMIADTEEVLNNALAAGKRVFFEGAQGTLLDIDHGTYPFVTSSSCTSGGAVIGSGVGLRNIDKVLGIAKAYVTRVGEGPFPTELGDAVGKTLTEVGGEYGVTTGRQRRCGWFDAVVLRWAVEVNGLTDICLTKLDVLSALDTIKICVAYDVDGKVFRTVPGHERDFERAVPIYEEMPGWKTDITACRSYDELPQRARDYIEYLEKLVGAPISIVAVGPDRDQTIFRNWK